MPTYTFYSGTGGGYLQSSSTSYSTARAGSSIGGITNDDLVVGQARIGSTRYCYESFLSFDLSGLPAGTITAATLRLWGTYQGSGPDFTVNARSRSWVSGGLTSADWVAGASLSSLTLLASFATSGFNASGYNDFTSQAALLTAAAARGTLEVILCSSRHEAGDDPASGTDDLVQFSSADASGTSQDPVLEVTIADAGSPWYYYAQQ